jgi:hypothetical protein
MEVDDAKFSELKPSAAGGIVPDCCQASKKSDLLGVCEILISGCRFALLLAA